MNNAAAPLVMTVRAIGAEFIRRITRPIALISVAVAIALLLLGGWLTTLSAWWWILESLLIMGALILLAVMVVIRVIIRTFDPSQSAVQKAAVIAFVNKLEAVAEHIQTPQIVVIYRVVRDIAGPRPDSFIESVSRDSRELAPDFLLLLKKFQ